MTTIPARYVRWCRDRTVMKAVEDAVSETLEWTPDHTLSVGIIRADGQAEPLLETTVGRFWLETLYRELFARPDCETVERVTFDVPAPPAAETNTCD